MREEYNPSITPQVPERNQGFGIDEGSGMTPNIPKMTAGGGSSVKKPASSGPSMFMKPNIAGAKKKFQMEAPSAQEQAKFDKLVIQEVKRQDQLQANLQSLGGGPQGLNRDGSVQNMKKLGDNMVAPKALVQKTQEQLAYQKFNPRPPSSHLNKNFKANDDDEDYDEGDGFEKEDEDDDLKLEKIKQAIKRENAMARQQAATNSKP